MTEVTPEAVAEWVSQDSGTVPPTNLFKLVEGIVKRTGLDDSHAIAIEALRLVLPIIDYRDALAVALTAYAEAYLLTLKGDYPVALVADVTQIRGWGERAQG